MEKFPFKTAQKLQPHEQEKPKDFDAVLKKFGNNVREKTAKENRKQSLRTTKQIEGWHAARELMTDEERKASE